MKKTTFLKLVSLVLCAMMLLSMLAACTDEPVETDEPGTSPETESNVTVPDETDPNTEDPDTNGETQDPNTGGETTEPETSEPETTEPETSEPETTEPETSEPETTEPETTEPETTEPETTEPETTEPETTEPEETEPAPAGDDANKLTAEDLSVGSGWKLSHSVVDGYYHAVGSDATATHAQHIWLREGYNNKEANGNMPVPTINIGKSQYMIVKMRTNNEAAKTGAFFFNMSTTGFNDAAASSYNAISVAVIMRVTKLDTWTTFVVDLNCMGDKFVADPTTGDYILDTFFLNMTGFSSDMYVDIEYIAFAEDVAEIEAIVGDIDVSYLNADKTLAIGKPGEVMAPAVPEETEPEETEPEETEPEETEEDETDDGEGETTAPPAVEPESSATEVITAFNLASSAGYNGTTYYRNGIYTMVTSGSTAQNIWLREKHSHPNGSGALAGGGSQMVNNINIGAATYMLVKMRVNNTSANISFTLSTTGWNHDTAGVTGTGAGSIATAFAVKPSETDTWKTYVMDITMLGKFFAPDAETGEYIIDTFYLTIDKNAAGDRYDIEYIGFAEDWTEISEMVGDETVVKLTNTSGAGSEMNSNGVCIACVNNDCDTKCDVCGNPTDIPPSDHGVTTEAVSGNTYTYTCTVCSQVVATKDFNVQGVTINKLLTPGTLLGTAQYSSGTRYMLVENGTAYWSYVSNSGAIEHGFMREGYNASGTGANGKTFDVGQSEWMVIKVKANTASTINFRISTDGYDDKDFLAGGGTTVNQGAISAIVNVGKLSAADTWQTFIVDLKTACGAKWAKAEGASNYVIDTFALIGGGTTTDIAYIAFVNTENEAKALQQADCTHVNTDCDTKCDICGKDGMEPVGSHSGITESIDGSKYTHTCGACGEVVAEKDLNIENVTINKLLTPGTLLGTAQYSSGTRYMLVENGTAYWSYVSNSGAIEHGFMREGYNASGTGANGKTFDVGQSEWMVIKVKANTASTITFRISTDGYDDKDAIADGATTINQGAISAIVNVGKLSAADTWQTFIVDLKTACGAKWAKAEGASNYVIDTFALIGGGTTTDIAYIAFVNTENEAKALAAAE